MLFELTPEQRQAVLAGAGQPLHIHDPQTQKVFLLIEQGVEPTLDEEYIRHGLDLAREQIGQGEVAHGNIEAVIAEAKRRHAQTA